MLQGEEQYIYIYIRGVTHSLVCKGVGEGGSGVGCSG
jgi:hypothetical protein